MLSIDLFEQVGAGRPTPSMHGTALNGLVNDLIFIHTERLISPTYDSYRKNSFYFHRTVAQAM